MMQLTEPVEIQNDPLWDRGQPWPKGQSQQEAGTQSGYNSAVTAPKFISGSPPAPMVKPYALLAGLRADQGTGWVETIGRAEPTHG